MDTLKIPLKEGVEIELVKIPSGFSSKKNCFIPGFYMGKYLVTRGEWEAAYPLPRVKQRLTKIISSPTETEFYPIESINWYEAVEFCDRLSQHTKLNFRLPTEKEWEYACLAGATTSFHFGELDGSCFTRLHSYPFNCALSNHRSGFGVGVGTTIVGSFPPNNFGLYDMHGNLGEWCSDLCAESSSIHPVSIVKGGSWRSSPSSCRATSASQRPRAYYSATIGFRVVCSISSFRALSF